MWVDISPKVRIGCNCVRQLLISVGLEANPNASCGRKVSFTNASEGGRLRRTSKTRGEKESQSLRHESYIVFRILCPLP